MVKTYLINETPDEYLVWRQLVRPALGDLTENVMDIWQYAFTEMFNNAVDHSGGQTIRVSVSRVEEGGHVCVMDDGVGIFRKIQQSLGLPDERQALLELAKGKLTTDPERHSGQGIFFTSRVLDSFKIMSGGVYYDQKFGAPGYALEEEADPHRGTLVLMHLNDHSRRTLKEIFDQYSSGEDYDFTKTVVPVRLAQYDTDKLISRSQAKQMLARVDRFKTVVLDFTGVSFIGQPFADEIFRVFARSHPEIEIIPVNENLDVANLIESVKKQGTK